MTVIAESFSAFARSLLAARPSKSSVIVPSASWSWKVSVSVHAWEFDVALVHALLGAHLVVDLLDVDRRDVVGEQHELVREDVVLVLVLQGLGQDGAELQQAHHKRSRTREGLAQASGLNTRGGVSTAVGRFLEIRREPRGFGAKALVGVVDRQENVPSLRCFSVEQSVAKVSPAPTKPVPTCIPPKGVRRAKWFREVTVSALRAVTGLVRLD